MRLLPLLTALATGAACSVPAAERRPEAGMQAGDAGPTGRVELDDDPLPPASRAEALALVERARALLQGGDAGGALPVLEEAIARDPTCGTAHLEWAQAAERIGHGGDDVRAHYALAVQLLPRDPRALALDAGYAAAHGDPEKARQGYVRVLELDPRHLDALVRLGRLELLADQPAQAQRRFAEALLVDDADVAARVGLADAAEAAGDLATAEGALVGMVKRFPLLMPFKSKLVAFYRRHDREGDAKRVEAEMERADPKDKRKLRPIQRKKKKPQ